MPVVESYPSIVGIAEVSQAAGQGRYNQWLAEFNTRSNVAKTNALMSGFSAGANVGMSALRMMQQQQQFAQRQGFIESQAATKLKADTDYVTAMMPALDPWVQQKMPHLTKEQRGAVIGKMDRKQIDSIVNSQSNAGQALAWHSQNRSPYALARQAEDTYSNLMSGQKHHNARVQSRLEPIHQRLRDSDFSWDERSVHDEIAKILQEEGEAKTGRSEEAEFYENVVRLRDPNTNRVVGFKWRDRQGKDQVYTLPKQEAGPKGRTAAEIGAEKDKAIQIVHSEHKRMLEQWKNSLGGYEPDPSEVGQFSQADSNGTVRHWRPARPEDPSSLMQLHTGNRIYTETRIPPRPTFKEALKSVERLNPEAVSVFTPDYEPASTPQPSRGGPSQTGQPVRQFSDGSRTPSGGVTQPGQPTGQVTPTPVPFKPVPPRQTMARSPALSAALVPSEEGMADYGPSGIEEKGRAVPGHMIQPEEVELRGSAKARKEKTRADAKGAAIKKIRKDFGNSGQKGLTQLSGAGRLPPTETTRKFEEAVRNQQPIEPFTSRLMLDDEKRELNRKIKGFAGKRAKASQIDIVSETVIGSVDPRDFLTQRELDIYHQVRRQFAERREYITRIAVAAVHATPPGERIDIGNIPSYTSQEFDLGVSRRQINVGDVILAGGTKGIHFVTEKDLLDSADRTWKARGVPLRGMR